MTIALSVHLLEDVPDIIDYRNVRPENISLLEKHKGLLSANVSSPFPQSLQLLKSFQRLLNGWVHIQIPVTQSLVFSGNTRIIITVQEHKKSKYLFLLPAYKSENIVLVECYHETAS